MVKYGVRSDIPLAPADALQIVFALVSACLAAAVVLPIVLRRQIGAVNCAICRHL